MVPQGRSHLYRETCVAKSSREWQHDTSVSSAKLWNGYVVPSTEYLAETKYGRASTAHVAMRPIGDGEGSEVSV